MSGVSVEVTIPDYPVLERQLGDLARRTSSMRPLMEEIGAYLDYSTKRRFQRGVAPDGTPWPESRRVELYGGQTMVETTRLMNSYVYHAHDFSVEEGSNAIYAGIHHFGGTIRAKAGGKLRFTIGNQEFFRDKVEIPARPALGLNEDDVSEIGLITENYLTRGGLQ